MTLVYRPNHPEANENGMVDRSIAGERPRDPAPNVISDTMSDTWHPGNNRLYDSKSNFRRATKAGGFVEVGNETQRDRRDITPKGVDNDICEAVQKVNQGYRPATEPGRYTGDGWQE